MSMTDPAPEPTRLAVRFDEAVPVLVIPDALPFERLREWLRQELPVVLADLGGRAARLDIGKREIQLFDVRRLLHLMRDEFQVEITGLYVRTAAIHRYAERELKLKLFTLSGSDDEPDDDEPSSPEDTIPGLADALAALADEAEPATDHLIVDELDEALEAPPEAFEPATLQRRPVPMPELPEEDEPEVDDHGGRRVLTITRTLRSGNAVRYDGDVHIFGDINAGAQVRAGGNVVVFGRCRGMVQAGAHGDANAFILAFDLSPTQLRIGRHIAIAPDRARSEGFAPEIARVDDDNIIIEPYRGRLGRR